MSHQNPLTLVTLIKPERLKDLYGYLSGLKYALEKGKHSLFENSKTIHYLRWVIIDDKNSENKNSIFFKDEPDRSPKLVFSSNFDGSVDKHLNDLCDKDEGKLIDRIYGCCIDYPDPNQISIETRKNYLKKCEVKVSAFYKGSPKRSLIQIRREDKLRLHLRALLDDGKWNGLSPKDIHKKLKDEVKNSTDFKWTEETFKMPKKNYFKLALLVLTIIILLPFIVVWLLIVQFGHEKKDKYFTGYRSDIDPKKTEILEEYEDLTGGEDSELEEKINKGIYQNPISQENQIKKVINYQNQFSQLVEMKPGKVRLLTFKGMMLFARVLIPSKFVDGELMNIPTSTSATSTMCFENHVS